MSNSTNKECGDCGEVLIKNGDLAGSHVDIIGAGEKEPIIIHHCQKENKEWEEDFKKIPHFKQSPKFSNENLYTESEIIKFIRSLIKSERQVEREEADKIVKGIFRDKLDEYSNKESTPQTELVLAVLTSVLVDIEIQKKN